MCILHRSGVALPLRSGWRAEYAYMRVLQHTKEKRDRIGREQKLGLGEVEILRRSHWHLDAGVRAGEYVRVCSCTCMPGWMASLAYSMCVPGAGAWMWRDGRKSVLCVRG